MPYLGRVPAAVPVDASDIPDNSITAAKILDGVITIDDIGADAVGLSELSATGTASATTYLSGTNAWTVPYTHPIGAGDKHIPTAGATDQYLKYSSSGTAVWADVAGGATGAGGDKVFMENELVVTTNYELSANKSALSVGPVTINTGISVTIPTGHTWIVL
jgi:hypothetical protein